MTINGPKHVLAGYRNRNGLRDVDLRLCCGLKLADMTIAIRLNVKRRFLVGEALTRSLRHTLFPPVSFKAAASKAQTRPALVYLLTCMLPAQVDNSARILPLSCFPPPEMIERGSVRKVGPPKVGGGAWSACRLQASRGSAY